MSDPEVEQTSAETSSSARPIVVEFAYAMRPIGYAASPMGHGPVMGNGPAPNEAGDAADSAAGIPTESQNGYDGDRSESRPPT